MNDEQRKASVAIFGEEFTNSLVAQGEQKTAELEEAGVANKGADTPEEKSTTEPTTPETVTPEQLVNEMTSQVITNLNEALLPVLQEFQQQIAGLKEQVNGLAASLKTLKGEQDLKAVVEMPRFTFQALQASRSPQTVVPEGDALKNQKPQEVAPIVDGGSLTQAYFPTRK